MDKRGQTHEAPPKQFAIPADLRPLGDAAGVIISEMRKDFHRRMHGVRRWPEAPRSS